MKPVNFNAEIGRLLAESHLLADDLVGTDKVRLFGHEQKGQLIGLVGLEFYGDDALLRSLVIAPSARGAGLGAKLVAYAERHAVASGATTIYLLTTTAEKFFKQLGYSAMNRQEAPYTITSTTQFSSLCPTSAAFMVKHLDNIRQ